MSNTSLEQSVGGGNTLTWHASHCTQHTRTVAPGNIVSTGVAHGSLTVLRGFSSCPYVRGVQYCHVEGCIWVCGTRGETTSRLHVCAFFTEYRHCCSILVSSQWMSLEDTEEAFVVSKKIKTKFSVSTQVLWIANTVKKNWVIYHKIALQVVHGIWGCWRRMLDRQADHGPGTCTLRGPAPGAGLAVMKLSPAAYFWMCENLTYFLSSWDSTRLSP